MKVSAVIPAAGRGTRMGADKNKQFLNLLGQPILARTIGRFQEAASIDQIIIVTRREEIDYCRQKIIEKYSFDKVKQIVAGGSTRQESVYNGLSVLDEDVDFTVVHDGARPLLKTGLIERIVQEVQQFKAVITGVPLKDTVKKVNQDQIAVQTPDRSKLRAVQTPQAFERELIIKAYQRAQEEKITGTDSSSLVEAQGRKVKVVEGTDENLKITTPRDLEVAKKILEMRQ